MNTRRFLKSPTLHPESFSDSANLLLRLFAEKSSRQDYLEAVAALFQELSKCRCVGIRALNERGEIPYEAYLGFTREFWKSENLLSVKDDNCACIRVVTGNPEPQDEAAMTPGGSFWCEDVPNFVADLSEKELSRFRGVCVRDGFASIAIIPLRYREKIVGAIHLADTRKNRISYSLIESIESITPLIGEALHRFDLEDEVRRNYDAQRVINSMLSLDLAKTSIEELLSQALERLLSIHWLSLGPAGAVFLAEEDGATLALKAHSGLKKRIVTACSRFPFGRCFCGRAASNGRIFFFDSHDGPREECCKSVGAHGHYCVPIQGEGKAIGVINLALKPGRRRDQREEDVLTAVANTLAGILERKRAEEALSRSEEKYTVLVENSLTGIFLIQDGLIKFANHKLAELHGYSKDELIGMDPGQLVHPEDRKLADEIRKRKLARQEAPPEYEIRGLRKDGRTIWLQRISTLTEYNGRPAILGNMIDITKRKQMEESLRKSEAELRHLSSRLITAQEDERRRIALELHDTIAQDLISINLRLSQRLIEAGQTDVSGDPIISMVGKSVEEIRRIMADLRPSVLDDLGVLATIQYCCREFMKIHPGIQVAERLSAREEAIPEPLKVVIFRVMQEALNNIGKHSKAENVRVALTAGNGSIQLAVEDDGTGFDLEAVLSRKGAEKGIGLSSMRERTELAGGTFSIQSRRGKGTKITASWPISRE